LRILFLPSSRTPLNAIGFIVDEVLSSSSAPTLISMNWRVAIKSGSNSSTPKGRGAWWKNRKCIKLFREIPRAYHGAVLCGEKIVIFGGFNGREYYQHAKLFDLNRKSWVAITNMHDRRCYVAATAFLNPSGMHHVVKTFLPYFFTKVAYYCRSDAGAVVLAGRPTIIGGFDGRTIHNDIEMLDFASQLHGSSSMRSVRTGVSAVTYEVNSVIVVGGFNGIRRLRSTEFYDHRVGLWYPLPEMEITRSNFGIEIMNGSIYIAGGFDGTRTTSTVERFDMRACKWEVGKHIATVESDQFDEILLNGKFHRNCLFLDVFNRYQ
uniref:Kelch-like protein 10 n=1 Tax=Angiostrongylus costaricensis TaxID=334426 RepID=A0A158PIV6_ANGCS